MSIEKACIRFVDGSLITSKFNDGGEEEVKRSMSVIDKEIFLHKFSSPPTLRDYTSVH